MTDPVGVPRLVPARMLNEFTYCPRLFYLEWVEGLFEENADTAEGTLAQASGDSPRWFAPRLRSA